MTQKTDFAVGRVEKSTERFDYVRVNERNMSTYSAQSFDEASKYDDLETAKTVVQAQNMMSQLFGDNYVYKVVQRDMTMTVLDENGEEEDVEAPVEEEPTEGE